MSAETERRLHDAVRRLATTWHDEHPGPEANKAYAEALEAHVWDAVLEERGRIRQAEHEARRMERAREEELRAMRDRRERARAEADMLLAHGPLTMTTGEEKYLRNLIDETSNEPGRMLLVELDKLREAYGARDSRLRTFIDSVERLLEAAEHGTVTDDALHDALATAKGES